ncbi:MAG: SDR family oxidoreductase [Pseudomonadota bacterium]
MTTPSRALVTGGAGFIGSHLVDRLLRDGHEVTVIDNLSSGRLENLADARRHPGFELHQLDVADHEAVKPLFAGIRWVFHLAGIADIVPSVERPLDYYRANVTGTASVVEAARLAGSERLVYAASSSCYGIPATYPTSESETIRPQYPYALSKYLGEQIVLHWAQVYGLQCVSLRLFNVYGPRSRTSGSYGAVFGVFLAQKLAGKPLTVVGTGEQTRDFTFVDDVVSAFVAAATAARSDLAGEAMNIGSGRAVSVNRLVELLGGEVVHIPERPGEPRCTLADNSKALRLLGWQPRVTFEKGVTVMLEHIERWRDAPVWEPASIERATAAWHRFLRNTTPKGEQC